MRHSGTGIFLLSLASILVFLHTIEGSAQEAKSIEAAKQEKQLRIYSLMPATYNQAIADAFTQQYPFARIITYRSRGETLLQRVLDEARAGINNFDVLFIDTYETLAIKRRGLLLHYVSPEARSYRAVDRDPEGYWTDFTNIYIVISYNHQIVPKKHVPADWGNLLDPYWKEKIGLDENEFEWYGSLGYYWGRERMLKFMKALKAQSLQIRSGHTLLAQLNAAGEIPLSINYAGSVDALVKRGAPLSWVKTTRPIIYKSTLLSIAKRTESSHLAKLFVDFCLSNRGQNEVVKAGSAPARPGILADEKNLNLRPIPLEVTRNINRYMKEFRQLFVR